MYSIWLYFMRKKGILIGILIIIALGVSSGLLISAILGSFENTRSRISGTERDWVEIRQPASPYPGNKITTPGVDKTVEAPFISLGYPLLGTAVSSFLVYGLEENDRDFILDFLDLNLVAGQFPKKNHEIVLPRAMLNAKNLGVGELWQEEGRYFSRGEYRIVGALEGENWIGLMGSGFEGDKDAFFSTIVFSGDTREMEKTLAEEIKGSPFSNVIGPVSLQHSWQESYRGFIIISWAITGGIALVISIILALVSGAEFKNRRSEIVILSIIGYPRSFLYQRTVFELAVKAFGGWVLGLILALGLVRFLNQSFFSPMGMTTGVDLLPLLISLLIPGAVILVNFWLLVKTFRGDPLKLLDDFGAQRKERF